MAEREVRYCTTEDGVRIAYCIEGRGPPLLFVDGFLESFALDHLQPSYQAFVRQIGQGRTLVRYDPRGVGLSQRTVEDLSPEANVLDLGAVVAAAKLEGFTLCGGFVRGVVAIGYAVSHSERISALILADTFARTKDGFQRDILEGFAQIARMNWEMAAELLAHLPGFNASPDEAERLARVFRESTSGDVYAANVLGGFEIDLVERLPSIKCRTLVLHHLDGRVIPFALGQALAEQIPNARLVPLAGGQAWLSDTRTIIDAVNSFLDEDPQTRRRLPRTKKAKVTTPLRTVLFTDLVGHTYLTLARDLDAVLSAARLESVTLMTAGLGALLAIWYAVSRPQTVRNLILSNPSVSIAETVVAGSVLESLAHLARTNWSMACHAMADALVDRSQRDAALSLADWWMESVTGEMFAREVFDNLDVDLSGELANVKAPTLLIYRAESGKHQVDLARRIALAIPNCSLAPIAGKHLLLELDETGEILRLVDKFVPPAVHAPISKSRARFRTVLFTDLVGHTEMMSRLGDERGRDVLREHERITREVLKANGGTEVKTMGDGFLASFSSVTKAVECAIALQRAFADREGEPLSVRVGLNAGEPIEEDGDLFGATVILASRIAAKADGGEILVADTVRGLCSGKGFVFADRGEFVAKGFDEPVRVYEVSWRNSQQ